jgi:voltage-gated potassium channel
MIFLREASAAVVLVTLTLSLQCAGMAAVIAWARPSFASHVLRLGATRSAMLMMRLMTAFIGLHVLEILLWAGFYRWLCFPSWESAFYFSAASYATVGYGDVVLPWMWRTLGPVESISGVLMCGLSASFLFAIVSRLVDREARVSDTPSSDAGDTGPETRIHQSISRTGTIPVPGLHKKASPIPGAGEKAFPYCD